MPRRTVDAGKKEKQNLRTARTLADLRQSVRKLGVKAPLPPNDKERLQALQGTGILNSKCPEPRGLAW